MREEVNQAKKVFGIPFYEVGDTYAILLLAQKLKDLLEENVGGN